MPLKQTPYGGECPLEKFKIDIAAGAGCYDNDPAKKELYRIKQSRRSRSYQKDFKILLKINLKTKNKNPHHNAGFFLFLFIHLSI